MSNTEQKKKAYDLTLMLAKEYASSGAMKDPSHIGLFLQAAYNKLNELAEDKEK